MNQKQDIHIYNPDRTHFVGDGFKVYTMFPTDELTVAMTDPFLMLDYNAPWHVEPSDIVRGVGAHPHAGFETVTIAYSGSVTHKDSGGNTGSIHAGDVQWMTAGRGVVHEEYHESGWASTGGEFHMVQLWVNLPAKDKRTDSRYQTIRKDDMPHVSLPDGAGYLELIAGEYQGVQSLTHTHSPILLANVYMLGGGAATLTVPRGRSTLLLVVKGSVRIEGEAVATHSLVYFPHDTQEIAIRATEDAVCLLLSGEPLNESVAWHGPFVMNSKDELYEVIESYRRGDMHA